MTGLYTDVRALILAQWAAGWTRTDVPAHWRDNDPEPLPDPSTTPYFFRNEIDFGRERVRAFGGGRFANERVKYGSVLLRVFAARYLQTDTEALDLLWAAESIFRSTRQGNLSFIGGASGFDVDTEQKPEWEAGNWYMRASLVVFEYRFIG
jgi:hypothetical protein